MTNSIFLANHTKCNFTCISKFGCRFVGFIFFYISVFISFHYKTKTKHNWKTELFMSNHLSHLLCSFFGIRGLCANLGVKKMTARTWNFYDLESMMVFRFFHFEIFNTFSITFVGICVFEFDDCQKWKKKHIKTNQNAPVRGKDFRYYWYGFTSGFQL